MDASENTPKLHGRRILVGVAGGIAAYKAPELVRRLREYGADVRVAMTGGAMEFVTPLTFQAVSGHPVHSQLLDAEAESGMGHIELARWAELIVVAPATADLMARLAAGMADDLLTTVCLASEAPVVLAPAMNRIMWAHTATRSNASLLTERGVTFLGPDEGDQACGEIGPGRMMEPPEIAAELARMLVPGQGAGLRVLLTAGPTYEDLDPVRFVGNRSSGKMGFALARAFAEQGAEVTVVAGPVQLATPAGVTRVDVRSASQMHAAVMKRIDRQDIFVGAAAVADFRPEQPAPEKIKKGSASTLTVELVRNPDILADVAARKKRPFTVGFAAETENLVENARKKLNDKRVDLIAANAVGGCGCAFDAEDNALTVLGPDGQQELARADKLTLARQLAALITNSYRGNESHGAQDQPTHSG